MIEISWLWLPLIITVIFAGLSIIREIKGFEIFITLLVYSVIISTIIYVCYGIYWIATHVKIV
jgi:hypothetical protein